MPTWGVPMQNKNYASLFSSMVCFGYIAFIIKFTADYRDFAAIKLIYMLPGVLPFAVAILEGMHAIGGRLGHVKTVACIMHCALLSLVVLHCAGIIELVKHLADRM